LKYSFSRSDGRGQGRRHPASFASEPLTAGRRGGYPLLTSLPIQPATRVRFDGGNSTRYRHLTDPEVFEHNIRHSDAHEMDARSSGFENCRAHKEGVETMNRKEQVAASRPTITAAEPQLFVTDIGASLKFFTQKLGFTVAFEYGRPPFYAQV